MSEARAWEKLPQETAKAYKAFQVYLSLVDHANPAQQTRSVRRTGEVMQYNPKSISLLEKWSSKYDWIQRAASYDAYMGTQIITYKVVELAEYQANVIGALSQQLTVLDRIVNKKLMKLNDHPDPDPIDIKRMVEVLRHKDDLARRAGRMPTSYIREQADEDEDADIIFVIGGGE